MVYGTSDLDLGLIDVIACGKAYRIHRQSCGTKGFKHLEMHENQAEGRGRGRQLTYPRTFRSSNTSRLSASRTRSTAMEGVCEPIPRTITTESMTLCTSPTCSIGSAASISVVSGSATAGSRTSFLVAMATVVPLGCGSSSSSSARKCAGIVGTGLEVPESSESVSLSELLHNEIRRYKNDWT